MKISSKGLSIIKKFEGYSSTSYLCPAGISTIGYGSTYYENGTRVTLDDKSISKALAEQILEYQVSKVYGAAVNRYVNVPLTQNQFDAITSLAYNIGVGNLQRSTLLRKLNQGKYKKAAKEFSKWRRSGGKVLKGLVKRRKAETDLFNS